MPTPAHSSTNDLSADGGVRRTVLWIGAFDDVELGLARYGIAALCDVIDAEHPQAAVAALTGKPTPALAVLAADRPGRSTASDALQLARAWPLMPIVSVASSLVDGRRRSGPPLPGIDEVPWHDLPGRCGWWLAAFQAGIPTSLGLPATSRREERLLESLGGIARVGGNGPRGHAGPMLPAGADVSVAAARADDLDGLCDLLTVAGHRVIRRQLGRPHVDEAADTLVWDVGDLTAAELEWLRLLSANRPDRFIVLLESFPRGDAVAAAMRAGAAAVLGRPVCLETLAGVLLRRRSSWAKNR